MMQDKGAGEIIVQSIERDGKMQCYDLDLIRSISEAITIPVVASGGAVNLNHMKQAYTESYANGLAAGSMFVYHESRNAVLVNYHDKNNLLNIFK